MNLLHSRPIQWFLIALVALILATSTYTVPSSIAGEGYTAISGYVISNIQSVVDSTYLN